MNNKGRGFDFSALVKSNPVWTLMATLGAILAFFITNFCLIWSMSETAVEYLRGPPPWPPKNRRDIAEIAGVWISTAQPGRQYTINSNMTFIDSGAGRGDIKEHLSEPDYYLFEFPGLDPRHQCWYNIKLENRNEMDLQFRGGDTACIKGEMKRQPYWSFCK